MAKVYNEIEVLEGRASATKFKLPNGEEFLVNFLLGPDGKVGHITMGHVNHRLGPSMFEPLTNVVLQDRLERKTGSITVLLKPKPWDSTKMVREQT